MLGYFILTRVVQTELVTKRLWVTRRNKKSISVLDLEWNKEQSKPIEMVGEKGRRAKMH